MVYASLGPGLPNAMHSAKGHTVRAVVRSFDTPTMHNKDQGPGTESAYTTVATLDVNAIRYQDKSFGHRGSRANKHSL